MDIDIFIIRKMEAREETLIIEAFERLGYKTHHMNTDIDGFPDIMAIGDRTFLVEMKYIDSESSPAISKIMEASQPVFMHRATEAGAKDIYLCVANPGGYMVYDVTGILAHSMAGDRLDSLKVVAKALTPISAVKAMIAYDRSKL